MKRIKIVVARYNENVEWTKEFPNVVIYNKGEPLLEGCEEVMLSNVGREGHTYYQYICDHYEDLDDYMVFLQGRPFDHSPNIISNLNRYYKTETIPEFEFLSELVIDCNLSGCRFHANLPLRDVYERVFKEKKEKLNFEFGAGAQFIVSKNAILRRPKSFYSNIVDMLGKSVNPVEGFVIERLHKLIFTTDTDQN